MIPFNHIDTGILTKSKPIVSYIHISYLENLEYTLYRKMIPFNHI